MDSRMTGPDAPSLARLPEYNRRIIELIESVSPLEAQLFMLIWGDEILERLHEGEQ